MPLFSALGWGKRVTSDLTLFTAKDILMMNNFLTLIDMQCEVSSLAKRLEYIEDHTLKNVLCAGKLELSGTAQFM